MPNVVRARLRALLRRSLALFLAAPAGLVVALALPTPADAATCATLSHGDGGDLVTTIDCYDESAGMPSGTGTSRYVAFRWTPVCMGQAPWANGGGEPDPDRLCTLQISPCGIDATYQELWGAVELATGRRWVSLGRYCRSDDLVVSNAVSDAMVLDALQRTGLPRLTVVTQPAEVTLVNLPTVLSTPVQPFETEFTLLGQQVDVVATATSFEWHHGDRTTQRTSKPGKPYPSMQITHTYVRRGEADLSVVVSWTARVRVNGGTWRTIADPVVTEGPATSLRIAEAEPVLSVAR